MRAAAGVATFAAAAAVLTLTAQAPAPVTPAHAPAFANPATQLGRRIETALSARTLAGAHVGVLAVEANGGAVLYARNADDDFVPASTLKLVVGSAALARLGTSFTFTTGVAAAGSIQSGTLQGDLCLRGGGDAQLSIADLDAAAGAVAAAGVQHVSGVLIADASRYDAPHYPLGWAIDDIPYEYAAVPGALSLGLNVAHVRVLPGDAPGAPGILQAQPQTGAFAIENATLTGARDSADTTDLARPWDRPRVIRVTGNYPFGAPLSDDLEPAVPDPAEYVADLFIRALAARGVTVAGGVRFGATPAGAAVLWTHRSKPLRLLLRDFWPPSTNLIGEQLLEELGSEATFRELPGEARAGDARERGIVTEMSWLRSIGVNPSTL
ncbi:MAG: D-alanyl-D-alanine carboxypeptidase/D-alanyl-D-alanine-endopeptidase, partial [Candidatus Tumulicola sp.]